MKLSFKKSWLNVLILLAVLLNAVGIVVTPAFAAGSVASDDFSTYTAGNIIGQTGTATGWSTAWSGYGMQMTTSNGAALVTQTSSMGGSLNHTLDTNVAMPSDGSSAYVSFLLTIVPGGDGDLWDTGLHVNSGGYNWTYGIRSGQFWSNGLGEAGSVAIGTQYLLVTRVTRNDAGNDNMAMWVNPTSEGDAPLLSGSGPYIESGQTGLNGIRLSVTDSDYPSNDSVLFDDIQIGTSFADVAGSDTTDPVLSVDSSPVSLTNSADATFEFSATDDVSASNALTFFCGLDGSAWESCASPVNYTGLSEGEHTFWLGVYDEAGNYAEENYSWAIDLTAPVTSIDSTPALFVNSTEATFEFSGTDNVSASNTLTFYCGLDGEAWEPCASPFTYTGLSEGFHWVYIHSIDEAGNSDEPGQLYEWTVTSERVLNGGFNTYTGTSKVPASWKAVNFATTDGKNTKFKQEGGASVKIAGLAGKTKTLAQTLSISGAAGDNITFSFWAKGAAIPAAGACKAQVLLYNGTTLKETKTISCSTGTYATFQLKTLTFNATSAYTKVVIKFTYAKASGTVWFDQVSLLK